MKIFTTFLLTISSLLSAPLIKLTPTFENQKIKLPVALATPADHSDCPLIPHQFEVSCKPTAFVEEDSGELLVLFQDGKIDTIAPSR